MSSNNAVVSGRTPTTKQAPGSAPPTEPGGALARMGATMTTHAKWVFGVWLIALVALGAAAPSVFSSLAGAGWQANGSESVQVRELAQQHFGGNSSAAVQVVVHSDTGTVSDPAVQQVLAEATAIFQGDDALRCGDRAAARDVDQPGRAHRMLIAGANASTDEMVKAVDDLKGQLTALSEGRRRGLPHRRVRAVERLQQGQPRRDDQGRDVLLAGDAGDHGARVRLARRRGPAAAAHPGRAGRLGGRAGAAQHGHADLGVGHELRDDVRPRSRYRLRPVPRRPIP